MVKTPRSDSGMSMLEIVVVVGVIGVIGALAVPMFGNAIAGFRLSGDARSVSNAVAVSKMRAAADFSRARLYVDLTAGTHQLQRWNKTTAQWVTEGGVTYLSQGVGFGYGIVGSPPDATQPAIDQAPACTDNSGTAIANTACIVFNSRGVPVDPATSTPNNLGAYYLTDGSAVYGVTVAATGMIRLWRTLPTATPSWTLN